MLQFSFKSFRLLFFFSALVVNGAILFGSISPVAQANEEMKPSKVSEAGGQPLCPDALDPIQEALLELEQEGCLAERDNAFPNTIIVLPRGEHRLNKIAKKLDVERDGMKLILHPNLIHTAFVRTRDFKVLKLKDEFWNFDIDEYAFSSADHSYNYSYQTRQDINPINPNFGHEMRHEKIDQRRHNGTLPPLLFTAGEMFLYSHSSLDGLDGENIRPVSLEEVIVSAEDIFMISEAIQNHRPTASDIQGMLDKFFEVNQSQEQLSAFAEKLEQKSYTQMSMAELLLHLLNRTSYLIDAIRPYEYAYRMSPLSALESTVHEYSGKKTTWYELRQEIPQVGMMYSHMVFDGVELAKHETQAGKVYQNLSQLLNVVSEMERGIRTVLFAQHHSRDHKRAWLLNVTQQAVELLGDTEAFILGEK